MDLKRSKIVEAYRRRTPGSAELHRQALDLFPSGVTHDGRYLWPHPIYVEEARGSRKWDVDGHEYVDYAGGHGALLLGHNHPKVVQAIEHQLHRGTHFGAGHRLEIEWARWVQRLVPTAERIRFTNSGTEATLLAIRLARAFTGREKVLRFAGHFHGWHDHAAFGVKSHYDGSPTPGVLRQLAEQVVLAPPGDIDATAQQLARNDVAAAIIEPTGASWGQVPVAPEFVRALRDLTAEHGVVLIFDEVITGFRVSPGGAQAALSIRPDLTTLAKILAGGLPGGAIVGRREILDYLAFPDEFSDPPASRREKIAHHGTYNANPVSAAAGVATLEIVGTTDACDRANRYAARLREQMNRVLREENVRWVVYGSYSGFHIFTNPEGLSITADDIEACRCDYRVLKAPPRPELLIKLRLGMLLHGVEIFVWPGGPTSAVHTEDDLERTVTAFRSTLRMLKAEGEC